jgi:hypothetical protein
VNMKSAVDAFLMKISLLQARAAAHTAEESLKQYIAEVQKLTDRQRTERILATLNEHTAFILQRSGTSSGVTVGGSHAAQLASSIASLTLGKQTLDAQYWSQLLSLATSKVEPMLLEFFHFNNGEARLFSRCIAAARALAVIHSHYPPISIVPSI